MTFDITLYSFQVYGIKVRQSSTFTNWFPWYFKYPPDSTQNLQYYGLYFSSYTFTYLWLFCKHQFVLLMSFTFFTNTPEPLSSDNYQSVLCICEYVSMFFNSSIFIVFSITIYPPSPSSTSTEHTLSPNTIIALLFCPCVLWLYPPTPTTRAVSPFLSMSLSLFRWIAQFVHQIAHMSEIIWYLSFSDWLISLSIMLTRSIHSVAKGKGFVLFHGWLEFHSVNVPGLL